jgi:hypothetical protein
MHLDELGLTGANLLCRDDLSRRTRNAVTLDVERLARGQLGGQPIGFLGRQSDNRAVVEDQPIDVAAWRQAVLRNFALQRR